MELGWDWAVVGGALILFGWGYNRLVTARRHAGKGEREVAFWVVGGVGVTLVGIGLLCGWWTFLAALFCFACSGLPMILGTWRDWQARRARGQELLRDE